MACHVLTITNDVSFVQLSRPNELLVAPPAAQVTTPDDNVLTDKLAIYKCLSAAATTSAAWMSRLTDDDINWHIDLVDRLGDAVAALLASNTRLHYEHALAEVEEVLSTLDKNADLSRFVRKYRKAADGTHFLDAFYAPLLLRLHIANRYYSTAANMCPVLDLETRCVCVCLVKSCRWLYVCAGTLSCTCGCSRS